MGPAEFDLTEDDWDAYEKMVEESKRGPQLTEEGLLAWAASWSERHQCVTMQ